MGPLPLGCCPHRVQRSPCVCPRVVAINTRGRSILAKQPGDGTVVPFHQDATYRLRSIRALCSLATHRQSLDEEAEPSEQLLGSTPH